MLVVPWLPASGCSKIEKMKGHIKIWQKALLLRISMIRLPFKQNFRNLRIRNWKNWFVEFLQPSQLNYWSRPKQTWKLAYLLKTNRSRVLAPYFTPPLVVPLFITNYALCSHCTSVVCCHWFLDYSVVLPTCHQIFEAFVKVAPKPHAAA